METTTTAPMAVADTKEGKRRATAAWGLFKRREKWTLSFRGWLALMAVVAIAGAVLFFNVHPFLAVTQRVDTEYLVIEGWIPNYALEESIAEFKSKPYRQIFTVGAAPLTSIHAEEGDTLAVGAYERLKWLGMNPDLMKPVPAYVKYRNRTFQSAVALRKWIEENHLPVNSFNLVTLGAHARRSRLLFEEAFGGRARVGIISVEDREYEPKRWWKYSEGVREVMSEGISYLYARFLFHPGKQ